VSFADVHFFAKLSVTLTVTQYLESLYEPNMSGILKLSSADLKGCGPQPALKRTSKLYFTVKQNFGTNRQEMYV